ncbi:MAG: DNA methyltransferase [Candidatus Pacearchaeota archaeon]
MSKEKTLNDFQSIGDNEENKWFFFFKNKNREIVPFKDEIINKKAKEKLNYIFNNQKTLLPKRFIENWNKVKLFDVKGNLEDAHSLIINQNEGSYDLNNKLNHLTGKEWTIFSCSWFIFNALPKDLKEERDLGLSAEDHPATYSPTMMENFIKFFTKEGMRVLDPFSGIGSTLVGCARTNRIGYGIELNPKYYKIALKRVPEFAENIVCGDSKNVSKIFKNIKFDFCISSPPYWDVLNRSTGNFREKRESMGRDFKYSENTEDLGNINDYESFLGSLTKIYLDIYDLLKPGSYIVIVVKNIKKKGKFYPLAWDLAKNLSSRYVLKDEKIWIQDKIGLAPYGYPYSWTANILHHYCLILKKEDGERKN